jgi:hypothetical protein
MYSRTGDRVTQISQDPARRIRRIRRWLSNVAEEFNGIPCYVACHRGPSHRDCECVNAVGYMCGACQKRNRTESARIAAADKLFAAEILWISSFPEQVAFIIGTDLAQANQTITEQKARITDLENRLALSRPRLTDEQISAMVRGECLSCGYAPCMCEQQ